MHWTRDIGAGTLLIKGPVRAYPALANGRYYVRNERQLAAFNLSR